MHDFWPENLPSHCCNALNRTLHAELRAAKQVEVNPLKHEIQDNVVSARVAGYFLIDRRAALGKEPYEALRTSIPSKLREPGKEEHDVAFRVGGRYRDHLTKLCVLYFLPAFPSFSFSSQSGRLPQSIQDPLSHFVLLF